MEANAEVAVAENSPRGSSSESKAFRLTHDEPSWGRSRLTDESIGVVWAWLRNHAKNNSDDLNIQSVLLFTEMLLFFGFPPDSLLNSQLKVDSVQTSESSGLFFTADSVIIHPARPCDKPAFAAPLADDLRPYYIHNGQSFALPLPKPLRRQIRALLERTAGAGNANFLFRLLTGKLFADKKNLNEIFKPLEEILGEKITVEKLAKSTRTLLREEGTLTALEIALVAGEIPHQTASPMFYSNYKVSDLREKYFKAVEKVIRRIIENSREYLDYLKITPPVFCPEEYLLQSSENNS